ncbi:hypothetical protein LshimejAT787_1000940 [Lyophyllum shimeji]|uniref:Carbohydrate-binding module family 67 protein n=1 Tax=Lyophyllum shimeji TaxID=47721 RepID=A0A9P3PTX2_LYOSH|nr:hypothetical protein LshimejAT787_1000940 [Lyophyllum shimeji]
MLKFFDTLLYLFIAGYATCVAGLDFTGANWIWIPNQNPDGSVPVGNATFRRAFNPTNGRVPSTANILIGADDVYTLYVNGLKVGTSGAFGDAQRILSQMLPGVVAAIQIKYSDGSTENIVTDAQWRGIAGTPAGSEQVAFDDSKWPPPSSRTGGSAPNPSLQSGNWIWTSETSGPGAAAPVGGRSFRKTIALPNGQLVAQAKFVVVADDAYSLYLNGRFVGSGTSWQNAQRYTVNFPPTSKVVVAVYASNSGGGPAGLLVSGQLVSCECTSGSDLSFITDGSWKYSLSVPPPAGFIDPNFDDSAWPNAQVKGKAGVAPWGATNVPSGNSAQTTPITGAPAAPPASVVA